MNKQLNPKFAAVADNYTNRYYFKPYYTKFVDMLEKYLGEASLVLDIGAADGIMVGAWDRRRKEVGKDSELQVVSIEPVERMVDIAKERAKALDIKADHHVGSLENAVESLELEQNSNVDGVYISKVLHEINVEYGHDEDRLEHELSELIEATSPNIVIIGIVDRVTTLTPEEVERFNECLIKQIGHGHDPARDYLDQKWLDDVMSKAGYEIIEKHSTDQLIEGFENPPWSQTITVYRKK